MHPAALPGTPLEHAAYDLGQAQTGITHNQPRASEAALFEAGQKLPPKGLVFAVTHLEAQQLSAAVGIDAHRHDDSAETDLQRLAQPAVEIRRVEVRVADPSSGRSRKAWIWPSSPCQIRLTSEREMPACEPIAATRASTLRVVMPMTQSSIVTA